MAQDNGSSAAKNAIKSKRRADPQAAGKILSLALKRYGLDREVARYEFVLHWAEIVGESIAARTRPHAFHNKLLVIRVNNPQWAQELSFQKEIIINRLNRFLKDSHVDQSIDDVRFIIGSME